MLRLLLREVGSLAPQLTKHSRRLFLIKTLSKTFNSWPCAVILEVWKCITVSKPSMSPNVSTFSIEGMVACTLLSALDHNANREHTTTCHCIKRCQPRRTPGQDCLSKTYRGVGGNTNFTENKQGSSQSSVSCNYCQTKSETLGEACTTCSPAHPQNITSKPWPAKGEVTTRQTSRFANI